MSHTVTHLLEDPVSALDSAPGISPDEVEAGGRLGVPVVFSCSTPSVAVTDLVEPVSVYCPSVRLTVDVSAADTVVETTVVDGGEVFIELESDDHEDDEAVEDDCELDWLDVADSGDEEEGVEDETDVGEEAAEDDVEPEALAAWPVTLTDQRLPWSICTSNDTQFPSQSKEVDVEIHVVRVLLGVPAILIGDFQGVLAVGEAARGVQSGLELT